MRRHQFAGRLSLAVAAVVALAAAAPIVLGTARPAVAQASDTGEGPAGPGPHTWTVEAMTFDVTSGPDDDIPVTIDADLWLPDNATAATPAPAVLTTHGFGGTKDGAEQRANAAFFASHGYVVLSYTSQGFGGSGGCIGLNSLDHDVQVAVELIDWLGQQPFVATQAPGDPRVGMVGGSYGGGQQGLVAITDPRLDAIVPGRTWNALQFSLVPNNWVADPVGAPWDLLNYDQGVFKQEWTSLFYGLGTSQPVQGNGGCDPVTQQTMFPGEPPCAGFVPIVCPIYASLTSTGDATDEHRAVVRRSSVGAFLDQLDTPTLLVQGMPDTLFTPVEATATFRVLQDRGTEVAMIWHSGGHGGYQAGPGEAEAYGGVWDDSEDSQAQFAKAYLPRRTLQWFERHVRGRDVDTGPAFAWFRDWVEVDLDATGGTAAPAFDTAASYPPAHIPQVTLALDPAAGALVPTADLSGGDATLLHPAGGAPAAYSETAQFSSPGQPGDQPPREVEGQHATFDTAPMDVDTEVVGIGIGALHLSHANPAQDVHLFAKFYEVGADGSTRLLRRQVAPSRIPDAALGDGPVTVRFPAVVERIEAGNRLRVVLATTDLAYYNARLADTVTVSSTPDAPSTVTIGLRALAAEPAPAPQPSPQPSPEPADDTLPATGGGAAIGGLVALAAVATARRRRAA